MPAAYIDFQVTEAEISLVDPATHQDPGADGKIEIFAVQADRSGAIGEPIFLVAHAARDMAHEGHIIVVHIEIIAVRHHPLHRGVVVGFGLGD